MTGLHNDKRFPCRRALWTALIAESTYSTDSRDTGLVFFCLSDLKGGDGSDGQSELEMMESSFGSGCDVGGGFVGVWGCWAGTGDVWGCWAGIGTVAGVRGIVMSGRAATKRLKRAVASSLGGSGEGGLAKSNGSGRGVDCGTDLSTK